MRSTRLFSTAETFFKSSWRPRRFTLLLLWMLLVATPLLADWEKVSVPTTANLRGLSLVGDNVVWASGTGGTVIRTIDGGKNWSVTIVPGAEKLDFRGIHAFDQDNAVIISSGPAENGQARIYRTIDGGKKWEQVFEEKRAGIFFDAVAFWDRRHGVVLSDPVEGRFVLFMTEDSGATWKQIPRQALPPALPKEGAFAASNSCLVVEGLNNVWFATGGAKVARVFHSKDRGKTWNVADTPVHPANSSSGIFSLAVFKSNTGVAVGGDYAHPGSSDLPNVIRTGDGGKTWLVDQPTDPAGVYLSSVAVFPTRRAATYIAVGTRGAFFLSPDHSGTGGPELNSIRVAPGMSGIAWAVGPKGTVTTIRLLVRYQK